MSVCGARVRLSFRLVSFRPEKSSSVKEEGVDHGIAAASWRVEVVLQRTLLSLARRESKSATGNGNAGRAAES